MLSSVNKNIILIIKIKCIKINSVVIEFFRNGEAILLDENLLHCRTEYCDTFANEPLCDKKDFACNVVEVYGFQ